ncbi:STAS domain-containing protein [Noviherbaspirillum aridicola]|uniref:STAS domain-containing protein n=1 Tax=Noviherbaspirillum aridicola TaxID=2849687 RepID=A0ABQ4Q114_9BURK|nr:STAS domain-containing protein [Noviherbaspirillum aridicola]GIZ50788.1 hypothetical protein NCCP691_08020 [Noviherbaspirillum aridicola]
MGIFSIFGKKDRQEAAADENDAARARRSSSGGKSGSGGSGSRSGSARSQGGSSAVKRDPHAARATALKIDAIESEMSSEFVTVPTTQPRPSSRGTASRPAPDTAPTTASRPETADAPASEMGNTTVMLLDGQTAVSAMAEPSADAESVISEAAILYANGQQELVEQMLAAAIAEDRLGDAAPRAWLMLFDLYQLAGRQQEFEQLAIEYANKFETSPPGWAASADAAPPPAQAATPAVPFPASLDAGCAKQVERIRNLAASHRTLRLEFARVAQVDAAGCALLLDELVKLQKTGHDLILVGASELAEKIRAIIQVGRREDTEAPWLLLLEILRLLNREQEFEETSIDYCVTFEVSPPAFTAPQGKVTTAAGESAPETAEAFAMPKIVEGRVDELILAIAAWSDEHEVTVIDCSRLQRVDFNAAGRLLTGLGPFCGVGKSLEFQHVNHLVTELFHVIGLDAMARVVPRKS